MGDMAKKKWKKRILKPKAIEDFKIFCSRLAICPQGSKTIIEFRGGYAVMCELELGCLYKRFRPIIFKLTPNMASKEAWYSNLRKPLCPDPAFR